jgi:hypothetical protein
MAYRILLKACFIPSFRFFPDEPNNHPIDVPNNQNNNPVPEADNLFGVASNAQSEFFNNPQNNVPANNPSMPQFDNNPQNNDFKANASPVPQPDYHPDNPLFQRGHRNSPGIQQVLSQRTPIQDDFIHQLPQAMIDSAVAAHVAFYGN